MGTAIVSLICIALVVFGGMTMSRGFLTSVDSTTAGLEELGERDEAIMRTELDTVSASLPSADTLQVTLENSGQIKLASFDKWDVIVQYYDGGDTYYTKWLPYAEGTPGNNEWTVSGIYREGQPEVFESDILNPGEEMVIEAKLNPSVGAATTNLVVVATQNGIPASIVFSP